MENPTLTLTFHLDTFELDIDAPSLSLDFALSLLDRARRLLEAQEKLVIARGVREAVENETRANRIVRNVKLQ